MVTRDSDGRHPNGSASENRENSQNLGRCNFKELYWRSSEGDQHNLSHSPKVNDQVSAQDRSLWETSRFILYSILYAALKQRGEVGGNHLIPLYSSPPEHRIVLPACFWQQLRYCVSDHCPWIPICQSFCCVIQSLKSLWHSGFKHKFICIIARIQKYVHL